MDYSLGAICLHEALHVMISAPRNPNAGTPARCRGTINVPSEDL